MFIADSSERGATWIRPAMLQIVYKSKARWCMGAVDFFKKQCKLMILK